MFSHIFIGVSDFDRALAFYKAVMAALGIEQRFCDRTRPWAGWQTPGTLRPLFLIGTPYDGQPHHAGNGQMVAFGAADRATVDRAYQVALSNGGTAEGAPGLRPEYHPHYYGAYFRDTEGNKLCIACHSAEGEWRVDSSEHPQRAAEPLLRAAFGAQVARAPAVLPPGPDNMHIPVPLERPLT